MTAKLLLQASCQCGQVVFEGVGKPIVTASCYCSDCREAGRRFEALPGSSPVRDADGGTPVILHRKDRVRCLTGNHLLDEHRLDPTSPTRRVLAACCNSPMFMDFTRGHWLSLYRHRCGSTAPPIEMRIMAGEQKSELARSGDIPAHSGHAGLMGRLLLAWLAMGFRRPTFPYGRKPSQPTESLAKQQI